jgi:short-subunit dehydrogenase
MKIKKIIITGASRGIGFELVRTFSKQGHRVMGLSRHVLSLEKLQKENSTIEILKADITNTDDLKLVSDHVKNNWGNVDILIHNAGKLINKPFLKTSLEDFKEVYLVNLFAVAELTKLISPYLSKGSHVLALSSMGGIQGSVKFPGLSAYSSSKGALITLMELLAEEFKDQGVSFNTLALGAVQTEMLTEAFPDYNAPNTPEEMAAYIADFGLKGHQYYNGKVLQVSLSTP